MELSSGGLSPFQKDFLGAFFTVTRDFFLTGGGALVGFYGVERLTEDLDLFTVDETALQESAAYLDATCRKIGAEFAGVRHSVYFRRYRVSRLSESVLVDFVYDPVAQVRAKVWLDGVQLDTAEEILANKLTTLVSRSAVRDYWDVYHLVSAGHSLDEGLASANRKDGGVDDESLAYVLSQIDWPALRATAAEAGFQKWDEVENFYIDLRTRLARGLLPPDAAG